MEQRKEYLNFTISETQRRTFEIPMEKVKEIITDLKTKDKFIAEIEVDLNDSYSIAEFFNEIGLDGVEKYELANNYAEIEVARSNIFTC